MFYLIKTVQPLHSSYISSGKCVFGKLMRALCSVKTGSLHTFHPQVVKFNSAQRNVALWDASSKMRYCTRDDGDGCENGGMELSKAKQLLDDMRLSGRPVPNDISDADMQYFATLTSTNQQKKCVTFMYRREQMRLKEKQKKLEKREQHEKERTTEEVDEGPMFNRIFLKVLPKKILEFDNWKLAQGMKFGQKLVFDFSYDTCMRRPDAISLSSQMKHVIHHNKLARDPFHLQFLNLNEGGLSHKEMVRTSTAETYDRMMVTTSSESLLERFPRHELVYLTPDSPNVMKAFDTEKTYVIGALVDSLRMEKGASLGIAKRLGIDHARLPIDLYLRWGSGAAKNLTLDQVVKIITEIKETGNWGKALEHVPTRKHEGLKTPENIEIRVTKTSKRRKVKQSRDDEFVFSRAKQQPRQQHQHPSAQQRQSNVRGENDRDFQNTFISNKRLEGSNLKAKLGEKKQDLSNVWEN